MSKLNKLKKIITALVLALVLLISGQVFLPANLLYAKAETLAYTSVGDDLSKDSSFNVFDYPVCSLANYKKVNSDKDNTNDIDAISIIQIGESDSRELFIYTYEPINPDELITADIDLTASSILMSTEENTSMSTLSFSSDTTKEFTKYSLKCVSSDDVFKKYLVLDFEVKSEVYRYYNIVEIERPFNNKIDEKISDETITNFKAHKVAQTWCCYYCDNGLVYERGDLDVVEITPTLTDFLYLKDGITWGSLVGINTGCFAHYIAFNIDNYNADRILDASIDFKTRDVIITVQHDGSWLFFWHLLIGKETERVYFDYPSGEDYVPLDEPFFLSEVDDVSYDGKGIGGKKYSWNRIMPANEFLQNFLDKGVIFDEKNQKKIENSQFVFAFCETDARYSKTVVPGGEREERLCGKEVSNVDILRIKFKVGKETYNLGVVSDTTSDDGKPGGIGSLRLEEIYDIIKKVIALILLVLICVVLWPVLSPLLSIVFRFLGKILRLLIRFIWKMLTFPFRLFRRSRIRKRKR